MQFALLIYESPEAFATRKNDENDPYLGAWRAYYKALVEAGIYVGGDPLQLPETGTKESADVLLPRWSAEGESVLRPMIPRHQESAPVARIDPE